MNTSEIRFLRRIGIIRFGLPLLLVWHLANTEAAAQNFWQQTNGPNGGIIRSIAINSGNHIFVGTNIGIFRSTDNGVSWMQVNNGMPSTSVYALAIKANGYIFAGTSAGVVQSTDNGESWVAANTGLANNIVNTFAVSASGNIWVGTFGGGIFRSTNNGGIGCQSISA